MKTLMVSDSIHRELTGSPYYFSALKNEYRVDVSDVVSGRSSERVVLYLGKSRRTANTLGIYWVYVAN